ncbi:TIGR02117 family protein [Bacteriovorax sp. PP10]|uniref:TIGR02117 family protein n=1 Tax=Bacteriovorax antarcticus TaxID=3088717 RepID=A0ABU5VX11_9BACT|nr:TIGR02117 family protein [Bacteriovorax sp. PP10]MEA9357607.1 TIGR02117 family protein [Bacteriovorax sp. PP10]
MKKTLKYLALFLLFIIGTYLGLALILQNIFTGEYKSQDQTKFEAYVSSSEIHTEFVFPVSNTLFSWNQFIPVSSVTTQIPDPKYIAIGWGSRNFFFNMKTWDEIKWGVILKAVFLPGESVLHVEYLKDLSESPKIYPLYLTKDDYLKLVSFIKSYFVLDEKGHAQKISEFSHYETDKFFKSHHSYHMLNTCNMWTQKGLEAIDAKRPIWAPFKYGIENAMQVH